MLLMALWPISDTCIIQLKHSFMLCFLHISGANCTQFPIHLKLVLFGMRLINYFDNIMPIKCKSRRINYKLKCVIFNNNKNIKTCIFFPDVEFGAFNTSYISNINTY